MANNRSDIRYAHETHAIFNEGLLQRQLPAHHDIVGAPWLSNKIVTQMPPIRREFEQNCDPSLAQQRRDLIKTEAKRREEQSGRGSQMVKRDRPKKNLNPPKEMAAPMDAEKFGGRWLSEQRAAAMAGNHAQSSSGRQYCEIEHKNNYQKYEVI